MQNLTYLAVFEPSTDGAYSIYFPDLPGCISFGNNLEEATRMATEAASLHVYSMECDNEEIPTPSMNLSKEDTEGNVVMPITIHLDLFRMKKDNERIKTNITLPAWLKRIAEEQPSTRGCPNNRNRKTYADSLDDIGSFFIVKFFEVDLKCSLL